MTEPYFHNGSVKQLKDAVEHELDADHETLLSNLTAVSQRRYVLLQQLCE